MTKFSFGESPQFLFPLMTQMGSNGGAAVNAFQKLAEIQTKFASNYFSEVSRFIEQRMQRDQALLTEVSSCRDLAALSEAQMKWLKDTVEDYTRQGRDIAGLIQKLTSEAATVSEEGQGKAGSKRAAA